MVRQRPTKTTGLSYGESLKPMDLLLESGLVLRWNLGRTWEPTWQHPVSGYIGQRWQRWSEGANGTQTKKTRMSRVFLFDATYIIYIYIYMSLRHLWHPEMWHTSVTDSDPVTQDPHGSSSDPPSVPQDRPSWPVQRCHWSQISTRPQCRARSNRCCLANIPLTINH